MSGKQLLTASLIFILFYVSYQYLGYKFGLIKRVPIDTPPPVEDQAAPTELPTTPMEDSSDTSPQALAEEVTLENDTPTGQLSEPDAPSIERQEIVLQNDVLTVTLDNRGGVIRHAELRDFYESVKKKNKVVLATPFQQAPGDIVVQGDPGLGQRLHRIVQQTEREVVFETESEGQTLRKTYTLDESFSLKYRVEIVGTEGISSSMPFQMVVAEGLEPISDKDRQSKGFFSFLSAGSSAPKLVEIAWSEEGSHESKPASKIKNNQFERGLEEDELLYWVGLKDVYFCNVFVPETPFNNFLVKTNFMPRAQGEPQPIPVVAVQASGSLTGSFYLGPLEERSLLATSPHLSNLVNYGYTGKLTKWMFIALEKIDRYVGNWGWSIVILTIIIRLILFPLTAPSIRSGYKMRKLQPKIEALKKKHPGTDLESKQKLSQATWKLYKEEKVNPFSSCITILPQMPIFIAYFSLLRTSISLRQSEWIFWINDLSIKDPTFILPILWGASMYVSQTMTPMPGDPAQQKMMKYMPVMMTLLFISMPSGLVLYMVTSNLFQLAQTVLFKWRYDKA